MSTNAENVPTSEDKTPTVSPGNYSPVTVYMEDSIGAIFLGILAVIFLVNWRRAESRNHRLMEQLRG
jgi:hypothetical protein